MILIVSNYLQSISIKILLSYPRYNNDTKSPWKDFSRILLQLG